MTEATGGVITYSGLYTIHTFTASGNFVVPGSANVDYLIVAGGGGGGHSAIRSGGGGGAGGMLTASGYAVTAQTYAIVVGTGGGAGTAGATGTSGNNSSFDGQVATGGGGGGGQGLNGAAGGSGGGGGVISKAGGAGTAGQGNNGGNGAGTPYNSGGGGGAGAVGGNGGANGGAGGDGTASSITGAAVTYAGGGGGGVQVSGTAGVGGAGGGGTGGKGATAATAGTDGLGGGGGGGGDTSAAGDGGDGIVIIRYLTGAFALTIEIPVGELTITGYAPTITTQDHHRIMAELSAGVWTNITDYVIGDITGYWGLANNDPTTFIADTGAMNLTLNNESGQFIPGLTTSLAGWDKGTPICLIFQVNSASKRRFYGRINTITPSSGAFAVDRVAVTVSDWMDYAAIHPVVNPSQGVNQTADEVLTTLVSDLGIAPLATDYDSGVHVFPTTLDNVTTKTKTYSEISKLMFSELGYCYLIKDPAYGETLVFDNAEARNGLRTPDATFDNSMTSLETDYGNNIINRFVNKVYPRLVDAAPVVLYATQKRIKVPSGRTVVFRGNYTDPNGGKEIAGINMVTPVITTDYTAMGTKTGGGSDYTANLTVGVVMGTEGTTFTLTNGASATAWVWIRIRGYGVTVYNPIETTAEDQTSIDEYDYRSITLDQKYLDEPDTGEQFGKTIVEQEKQPRLRVNKVNFIANRSDALMAAWLDRDVGDLVYLKETGREIDAYAYIQGVAFTISPGGLVKFSWIVKTMLCLALGLSPIACEFDPADTDGISFGHVPAVMDQAASTRSFSFWMYAHDQINDRPNTLVSSFHDDAGLYIGMSDEHGDDTSCIKYYQKGSPGVGIWVTAVDTVPQNEWVHIVVTRDASAHANAPHIYINAVDMALTNPSVQGNATAPETAAQLFIGNTKTATIDWTWAFDGLIKDLRIYDTILTQANVTTLEGGGDVTDGLVFQAPCVRSAEEADFEDLALDPDIHRLIDNMYGVIGFPNGTVTTRLIP